MTTQNKTWEIIFYKTKGWNTGIDVKLENETIWLNLNQMSDLFWRDKSVISRHIKSIYETQELKRDQTVALFATVQKEGKKEVKRSVEFYNLDTIISVWYRVNSKNATNFRIWATSVLKDHLIQWYSINQKRLSETWINEFEKAVALIKKNIENNILDDKEIK